MISDGNVHFIQELVGSDSGSPPELFGFSVAMGCGRLVVGAPSGSSQLGQAYIFCDSDGIWINKAQLTASDSQAFDGFGTSVSIHSDCTVVGSPFANSEQGRAHIFCSSDDVWLEYTELLANDGSANDQFGASVSIYGNYIIIGAPKFAGTGLDIGSAYIFCNSDGTWIQQAKLLASDGESNDVFGSKVAIFDDCAIIGAPGDNSSQGSAYIFCRSDSFWIEEAKITATDGMANDLFGDAVSIFEDCVIVGAKGDSDFQGAAYVFCNSDGNWVQQAKLLASDGSTGDFFGQSVSIFSDYAIIGAHRDNGREGSAYLFCNSDGTWEQITKLTASDSATLDQFGHPASLFYNFFIIGTFKISSQPGSVYVYEIDGVTSCLDINQSNISSDGSSDLSVSDDCPKRIAALNRLILGALILHGIIFFVSLVLCTDHGCKKK